MPAQSPSHRKIDIVYLALVLAVGIFLRLPHAAFSGNANPLHLVEFAHPHSKVDALGFDEGLYRAYLVTLIDGGLSCYPQIVEHYVELQGRSPKPLLPPVRFLYIFAGYVWHLCFGSDPLTSLNAASACATILTLVLSAIFAYRLAGRAAALAVTALMACAPTQIHMSQHALIDGFFAFWALLALWLLWENLQAPQNWRWLLAYICVLALLVLTKENSFFVWIAFVALLVVNRWLHFGTVTRELVAATVIGPVFGVVILILLAGGLHNLIATYQLLVAKASNFIYAVLTGDGPWYRYLVDLLLVSPLILVLALGTLFRLNRTMKPELFLSIFIAASYLVMCNVKYGMNLRYANMWDMPLRFLAFSQIVFFAQLFKRHAALLTGLAVALVALIELRQYYILAVQYPLYELITHDLMRALQILKSPGQ
jgi:4-amino-4-deoxy-L-arabinose transferase-like glycosyltransferase